MNNKLQVGFHLPKNYFRSVAPVVDTRKTSLLTKSNSKQLSSQRSSLASNPIRQSLTPVDEVTSASTAQPKYSIKRFFQINKRIVLFGVFTVILVLVSIAALIALSVLYATLPSTESNYGESCLNKVCNALKQLSCIDSICQCDATQYLYYDTIHSTCETKSILERSHGEECLASTTRCLNGTTCISSLCQCNSTTQYWNGATCLCKKGYNKVCSNTRNISICLNTDECAECSIQSVLVCNSTSNRCSCPSALYYYDTILQKCMLLESYYSSCASNLECDATLGLSCTTTLTSVGNCPTLSVLNRCDCSSSSYWDSSLGKCNMKKGYYRPCLSDCECDSTKNLQCYNNQCSCIAFTWHDGVSCVAQKPFGQSCSNHIECRFDHGLTCLNSLSCSCANPIRYYWDTSKQRCIECPAGWTLLLISGVYRCFLISQNNVIFNYAYAICKDYGAELPSVKTSAERDALIQQQRNESTIGWYWIGVRAIYCDGLGAWDWRYIKDNGVVDFTALPPWYMDPVNICPIKHCDYIFVLMHTTASIYNNPDYGPAIHRHMCEI